MLSPRQFEQQYGRPVPITVDVSAPKLVVVQADPDRYLIVFWAAGAPLEIRPGEDPGGTAVPFTLAVGAAPLVFDFAHHGSLPGMAWTLSSGAIPVSATYVVGRLVAPPLPDVIRIGEVIHGPAPRKVHRDRWDRATRLPRQYGEEDVDIGSGRR